MTTVESRLTKEESEELLDRMRNHGSISLIVSLVDNRFVVRVLSPLGH